MLLAPDHSALITQTVDVAAPDIDDWRRHFHYVPTDGTPAQFLITERYWGLHSPEERFSTDLKHVVYSTNPDAPGDLYRTSRTP